MTCPNCPPTSQPAQPSPCQPNTITVCQPIPFPVEPEKVSLDNCYADACVEPLTLQAAFSLVLAEICKLNPKGITNCTIPVGSNGSLQYTPILEAIANCTPHTAGSVLTSDGSNVSFVQPLSCTVFKSKLNTCITHAPGQATRVLGTGAQGIAYYEPSSLTCVDFLGFLGVCVSPSNTPAVEVLAYENGMPVKAPLPTPPPLDCATFLSLFSCVPPTTTPATKAITFNSLGQPVVAPLPAFQLNCADFLELLTDCPSVDTSPATHSLQIVGGVPTYRPLPADIVIPEVTDPCNKIELYRGKNEAGVEAFYPRPSRYNLTVGFGGTGTEPLGGFLNLTNLLFPTIVSEAGLCGLSSRYNPATGQFTAGKDGLYYITVNFYARTRITTSGAFTGTAQYSSYGALVVVIPASPPIIQGVTPVAGASSYRFGETQNIADNQVNNKTFTFHTVLALPAGSQVWVRHVLVNQPTGALTITSADLFATGINSGQDSFMRITEV